MFFKHAEARGQKVHGGISFHVLKNHAIMSYCNARLGSGTIEECKRGGLWILGVDWEIRQKYDVGV